MRNLDTILSPLDQFEIRDLFSINGSLLGNINISLTNIGLYLLIGTFVIIMYSLLATNNDKIISNSWSISQETLYSTVHSIVINQINANRGQIYFPFIYALFLFILINNLIGMVKRCLCVIINGIYILMFSSVSKNQKVRSYSSSTFNSSSNNNNKKKGKDTNTLNPYYITGFVDGEGCFTISIFKDSRMLTGWQVKPIFKISLHKKDRALLESIQRSLGVGKIYKHGKDSLDFRVSSLKNIRVVLNHFDKYPLITKKFADYLLFKQAVKLVEQKEHLTKEGLLKLVSIKAALNLGLSEKLKESFPGVIPAAKPLIEATKVKDFNWLRGFVEAEGSFQVISQNKDTNISLRFTITQHSRDKVLFESIVNYLGCGRCYLVSGRNEVHFILSTFSDIYEKIIPLFNQYPLLGSKQQDFLDFVKVAELIKSKDHLTKDGLAKILMIKNNMNSKRDYSASNPTE